MAVRIQYEPANTPRYWFSAPPYRWGGGRTPLTWEGWVVYAVFFSLWFGLGLWFRVRAHPLAQLGSFFLVLGTFLVLCRWKGEPARWA